MKWVVRTNRYSHEGSGFSVVSSVHETQAAAEAEAAKLRPHRRWAVAEPARRDDVQPGENN